jgi:uncharacterized protein
VIVRKLALCALVFFQAILAFGQYTPATVPNNKLVDNSYVSNPDNILNESTVAEIQIILSNIEEQTTAQVAVVALDSIGDADIFDFARELFNLWSIGRSNNNGLLILLATDQHTVRFQTGYGLEGALPDIVCKHIQTHTMVPSFKEGDYNTGMLNGVREVEKILTDPDYKLEITASDDHTIVGNYTAFAIFFMIFLSPVFLIAWAIKNNRFSDSKKRVKTDYPEMRFKRRYWLIEFGGIPLLIILLFWIANPYNGVVLAATTIYLYFVGTIFHRLIRERSMINSFKQKRKYFEITEYLRKSQWYWFFMAIIFPVPFLVYFPLHFVRKSYYRNYPRRCKLCDGKMSKLNEQVDDQYLNTSQQLEETLHSINYDVWKCTMCSATESWHFINRMSKYSNCPRCKARTYYKVSSKTVVSPTYNEEGRGEQKRLCKACGHAATSSYTISRLTRSSSNRSSGGSGSSSGGSWGGGSSGGGGASSSW